MQMKMHAYFAFPGKGSVNSVGSFIPHKQDGKEELMKFLLDKGEKKRERELNIVFCFNVVIVDCL